MKPYVICHIMSSVDGKIIPSQWSAPANGERMELMGLYAKNGKALNTDAWMFGRNTAQEGYLPKRFAAAHSAVREMPRRTFIAPRTSKRLFIVSDPEGLIFYDVNTVRGDNIVTIIGEDVSDDYLQHLQDNGISYVFAGKDGYNLSEAMDMLGADFGIKRISLQGGGIINGSMLAEGLVDELSLVVYPGVDGRRNVPSVFDCITAANPSMGKRFALATAVRQKDGVMWLRYKIKNA